MKASAETLQLKAALYKTILTGDAEEADQARLVYADCLEEGGDLPRANFIRAQCELAKHPAWERRAVEAKWEARALELAHVSKWRAELPVIPGVTWLDFERGFCATVEVASVATLNASADAIAAAAPIVRVVLQKLDEDVPAPEGGWPWLRILRVNGSSEMNVNMKRSIISLVPEIEIADTSQYYILEWLDQRKPTVPLERLEVLGEHTTGAGFADRIATEQNAATLERLSLGTTFKDYDSGYFEDPTLREQGALHLARAKFQNLVALDIDRQRVTNAGFDRIVATLPKLRELRARANELTSCAHFGVSTGAPIVKLAFGENQIGSSGASEIVQGPRFAALESLALDACEIGQHGVEAIVASPCWQTLRTLDLSKNPLALNGALALVEAAKPSHLHTLLLADCDFAVDATRLLGGLEWLGDLFAVDFSRNEVAPELLAALSNVRDISLAGCKIKGDAAAALGPAFKTALRIDLSNNPLGLAGLAALVDGGESNVQFLVLGNCDLGAKAVEALAKITAPRLRELALFGNPTITAKSIENLMTSAMFTSVRALDVSSCKLDDSIVPVILAHARGLRLLDIRHVTLTEPALFRLADAMPALNIGKIKLTGDPWSLTEPKRQRLEKAFGPSWWWHAEDEPPYWGAPDQ